MAVKRLANSNRRRSVTSQPDSPTGCNDQIPSSALKGPRSSRIATERSGSRVLRVVNSVSSPPLRIPSVATTSRSPRDSMRATVQPGTNSGYRSISVMSA